MAIDGLSGLPIIYFKEYEEARIIYENNVTEFPAKSLVLISLAKTYQELGRKEDAITWYKKTLAVNPGFEEAKNRIKELEQKLKDK